MSDLAVAVAYEHHLHYNRGGYPKVPKTWRINLASEITHVADVFDALRSNRPYRGGLPHDTILDVMTRDAGTVFNPTLLDVFFDVVVPRTVEADEAYAVSAGRARLCVTGRGGGAQAVLSRHRSKAYDTSHSCRDATCTVPSMTTAIEAMVRGTPHVSARSKTISMGRLCPANDSIGPVSADRARDLVRGAGTRRHGALLRFRAARAGTACAAGLCMPR